jgi:putative flippase GtrA
MRAARFLLAGGVSYVVNQACLLGLYTLGLAFLPRYAGTRFGSFDLRLLVASLIAVEASIVVRFAINDSWTFGDMHQRPLGERFLHSNVSSLAGPVISLACVNVLTPYLGISYLVANSVGILLGLTWNWFYGTRVVWRHPGERIPGGFTTTRSGA